MEDYTKTYNRLPHILNKNILLKERKFSTQEIIDCFKKTKYDDLTNRERVLVSKMFKEIKDIYDLKAILSAYESDVKNIKSIYINSPYCGFFDFWNSEFGLEKIPDTPFIPLKSSQIKSPTLRKLVAKKEALIKNIEYLEAVCWDYQINANDVYNILTTKNDSEFPIAYDVLRKKVLKYVSIDRLQKIFTFDEIVDIFGDIKPFIVRNPESRKFLEQLEIMRKAKNLIQQMEKEAIEIIEKRKLCKLKCKDDDETRKDFFINCFTKKIYSDLNYYERELINSLFEEENQETIQDLVDNYFLDIEDIKAIFKSSPYSENIEFLKIINELK